MIYEVIKTSAVSALFGNWEEMLLRACLQGVMGKIYVTNLVCPASAVAIIGDFAFLAGKPDRELFSCLKGFVIAVPQNAAWENALAGYYGKRAKNVSRYATKKEPDVFDYEALTTAVSLLPCGYKLCMIDEPLYHKCLQENWSRDFVSQFRDYNHYGSLGIGVVILKGGEVVSGASSYVRYREGIEIEVDTKKEYRRKGLAYVCSAKLILECRNRNLYPSWDAQNLYSLSLAQKLGYHYSHTYSAVEIRN